MTQPSRPSQTTADLPDHRDDRVFATAPDRRAPSRSAASRELRHLGMRDTGDRRVGRDGRFAGSTATPHPRPQPRSVTSERARL
jgi:hypothetical protein